MEIKEGIYFGMPEEEYHALPLLSRSMMEDLHTDIEEAWYNSWLNPDREHKETEAMQLGTAIHSAILEPENFNNVYRLPPKASDFEGKTILKTNEELADFLTSVGEKKTGKKEDLIFRAMPYLDPDKYIIWDLVVKEFVRDIELNGKRELTTQQSEIVSEIKESIERRPEIKKIFSKGYPEVVIIWKDRETGVKCKCRLDYVRHELIGELKSFSLKTKKSIFKACCDEIVHQKYNLQFTVYSKALETIIKKINLNEAEVFGEVDKEWLNEFLKTPRKRFFIAFVRAGKPYQSILIELSINEEDGSKENCYFLESFLWYRKALKKFKEANEIFGNERWIEKKYIRHLADIDVTGVQYQFIE